MKRILRCVKHLWACPFCGTKWPEEYKPDRGDYCLNKACGARVEERGWVSAGSIQGPDDI